MIHASPISPNCEPQNDRTRAGGGIVLSVTQGLHLTVYIALIRFCGWGFATLSMRHRSRARESAASSQKWQDHFKVMTRACSYPSGADFSTRVRPEALDLILTRNI
jgi:hypothetical protein